jgi:hypothetical protein
MKFGVGIMPLEATLNSGPALGVGHRVVTQGAELKGVSNWLLYFKKNYSYFSFSTKQSEMWIVWYCVFNFVFFFAVSYHDIDSYCTLTVTCLARSFYLFFEIWHYIVEVLWTLYDTKYHNS